MASMNPNFSARETAYQRLRSRIIGLDLKPNDVLNDKELEQQMGMSRTPIREAIIMLCLDHLVVVRPQSGTYVAPIDADKVEVEQYSRYILEKEMAVLACGCASPEHRRSYEENIHLYRFYGGSHAPDREQRMLDLDNEFHRITFAINRKEACYNWMQSLFQHIERIRILSLRMGLDTQLADDHEQIAGAILAGDQRQAVQWLERHLTRYQDDILIMKEKFPHYFKAE